MADTASFAKMVPGFDFLQGLVKNAGSALPSIGQWVAPTLNPEELEKRIEELRTVQFWLEQNARMLGATIQALEVQRMTLSTLKTMNVQMSDLRESLSLKTPGMADPEPPSQAGRQRNKATPRKASATMADALGAAAGAGTAAGAGATAGPAGVDPMQWWGALTKQFTQLAANTMKDSATDAAKNLAGAMVKQSFDAAGETLKQAMAAPVKAVAKAGVAMGAKAKASSARAKRASTPRPAAARQKR